MLDPEDVFLTALALAKMVRQEYGSDISLSYIASVWGYGAGVTSEEIQAVLGIEKHLDREIREQQETRT